MISVILSLLAFGFLGAENVNKNRTFSEEAWVFGGSDSQFVIEAMMPDFGHIIPVVDDTVLDGVVEFKDTFFSLGFFSHVYIFVIHADHDVIVFGSSHD